MTHTIVCLLVYPLCYGIPIYMMETFDLVKVCGELPCRRGKCPNASYRCCATHITTKVILMPVENILQVREG